MIKNCSYYILTSANTSGRLYSSPSDTCGNVIYYDPHGNELLKEPVSLIQVRLGAPPDTSGDEITCQKKFYIPDTNKMKCKFDNLANGGVTGENLPCPVKIQLRICPKRGSRVSFFDKHDNIIIDLPLFGDFEIQDIAHETKYNGIMILSDIYYEYIDTVWVNRNADSITLSLPKMYEEYDRHVESGCTIC